MRRGIPSNPETCMGKNVTLNPTKTSQNATRPSVSLIIRPQTFGTQ